MFFKICEGLQSAFTVGVENASVIFDPIFPVIKSKTLKLLPLLLTAYAYFSKRSFLVSLSANANEFLYSLL